MKKAFYIFLDFFLPQYCTGCGKKLNGSAPQVCEECINNILHADSERIAIEFERKFKHTGYIKEFLSPYVFESEGSLQNIIHSIKYDKKFRAGKLLGMKIAESLLDKIQSWKIDLIIPVPLHHLKKAERGFNQSYFIVKGLSDSLKIHFSEKIIKRIRFTESQTKLDLMERGKNVAGAFKINKANAIRNKNILLVDDVITTGATVNECARVLKNNGAKNIYACSVAIAE